MVEANITPGFLPDPIAAFAAAIAFARSMIDWGFMDTTGSVRQWMIAAILKKKRIGRTRNKKHRPSEYNEVGDRDVLA